MEPETRSFLSDLASQPNMTGGHREKMFTLLRHFASIKLPLTKAADEQHLNRSVDTLKAYCREGAIAFPDYIPIFMREKSKDGKPKKV